MRPKRVLIIVQNLPVPLDRRVWMECQALVAQGYGVSVICPKGPGDPGFQQLDGVRIHKYRPPPPAGGLKGYLLEFGYCWLRTVALAVCIKVCDGFDAIQACNPPDTYWALALLFKPFGVPFVYDQHDLNPEVYASRFGRRSGVLYRCLLALERATYRTADHVISTNQSYREVALTRGGKWPAEVSVVISGPDASTMRPGAVKAELRRGKRHLCCWLGIMGPQDGVELVLHATGHLVHDLGRDDIHVALLGFGDCLEELRRLATALRLDEWVTFTGRAGPELIIDYLSTADIGLTPDPSNPLNEVSTMNKTMEYMAFGLPVVATGLKETRVTAGDAAVYVASGDPVAFARAMAELLDDPPRRAAMGRQGRQRVEQELAWEHQAPTYVSVFERLIGPLGQAPTARR
ncbi:MAG: glycosyltransferase family 4 protein [Acidimicrobiales bacterium]